MGNARRPSFKGCCAMCALGKGRVRGQGHAERITTPEKRVIGHVRRVVRGEVPADQLVVSETWADRVDYWGAGLLDPEDVAPEFAPTRVAEHVPVNAAPTHDTEGWRTFGPHADVCLACSEFSVGRLVPVSFCPRALAALDAEEARR